METHGCVWDWRLAPSDRIFPHMDQIAAECLGFQCQESNKSRKAAHAILFYIL